MKPSSFDLAIIGAGPAGVAAAVTAARLGARVLLVERDRQPGGTVADGMHTLLCGLYRNDPDVPFDPLNPGFATEFVRQLDAAAGTGGPQRMGRVEVHAFEPSTYRQVLEELLGAQPRLQFVRQTEFRTLQMQHSAIKEIELAGKGSGRIAVGAVIDATGNGTVIQACNAGREPDAGRRQMAAFCLRLATIDDTDRMAALRVPYQIRRAVDRGELPPELKYTTFRATPDGGGVCKLSLSPDPGADRTGRARALGVNVLHLLRRSIPQWESATVIEQSPRILDRDGPALRGRYRLSARDVLDGRRFDDGCVRAAWPIEFWHPETGPVLEYLPPGAWYEIPARSLRAAETTNLFAAGKCISATERAQASLRVTGTCLALGEAAAHCALGTQQKERKEHARITG